MTTPPASRRRRGPLLAVLWFSLSTVMLVWPVYPWLGNHVHPRVLGLPWSLVYVLLVIAANFVALLVLHRLRVVDDREVADPEATGDGEPAPAPAVTPAPAVAPAPAPEASP